MSLLSPARPDIAMTNNHVAAWSSDGRVCGPAYLIGDDAVVTEPENSCG